MEMLVWIAMYGAFEFFMKLFSLFNPQKKQTDAQKMHPDNKPNYMFAGMAVMDASMRRDTPINKDHDDGPNW